MDRRIVYSGQIPRSSDLLYTQRATQNALSHVIQTVLGTGTVVSGLTVSPSNPAGLSISVGAGTLVQQTVGDQTSFGTLGTNASQIMSVFQKDDSSTFALATPGTSGQSINYLVQVQGSTVDGDSIVLPYYNAANPSQALQGPTGSGTAQATSRKDTIVLGVKAGTPATTGSQTTPSADSGYYPLAIVTVANGATTIISDNITVHPQAPIQVTLGSIQQSIQSNLQKGSYTYCVDTSPTSNSIVCALSPAPTSYSAGLTFLVKVANPTTGATTINLNGLGPKSLRNSDSSNVSNGEISAGQIIQVVYDGSVFQIGGANPSSVSNTVFQVSGATQRIIHSSAYTVQSTDRSAFLVFTNGAAMTLPTASTTAGSVNFTAWVKNGGTGDVAVMVSGSDTVDGIYPSSVNNQITTLVGAWNSVNATITPSYSTAPDSSQSTARVQLNANPGAEIDTTLTTAVPTASTLAVWVKGTSASQTFRFGVYNGASVTPSADQTATTGWQRFTLPVSAGVTKVSIMSASSGAAADLVVWGARLEAGTTSTAYIMYPGETRLFSSDGVSAWVSDVFMPFERTFTSSASFITPPGYPHYFVEGMGGGGGGCGGGDAYQNTNGAVSNGRGGAGAAYDARIVDKASLIPGRPVTAVVGAGGQGGYNQNNYGETPGQAGGSSSFGSFITIAGGFSLTGSSNASQSTYGGDGSGSYSQIAIRGGGCGGPGGGNGVYDPTTPVAGGVSLYAGNGGAGGTTTVRAADGVFPGGGGGGSANNWQNNTISPVTAGIKGGNGASGYIRVAGRIN